MLYFFVFIGIFKLLQNEKTYTATLGKIAQTYENRGTEGIIRVNKPYTSLQNEHFDRWDASIYYQVKSRMYVYEEAYFGYVRGAFFPLFPLVWKISQLNFAGISLFNYFLFAFSVMLLLHFFSTHDLTTKLLIFTVFLSVPSTIIFGIPYTESLFIFTSMIVFIGLHKNNFKMYFIGALLLAMVRPATVFVCFSIVFTDILISIRNKNLTKTVNLIALKITPFISGYFLAVFIQFLYSGSWLTYLKAQSHWEGKIGIPTTISDWSLEGFGLSSFAISFVTMPVMIYTIIRLFQKNKTHEQKSIVDTYDLKINEKSLTYIFTVSSFYIISICWFIFFTSQGNIHSYFRFILCSPAFYVILLYILNMSDTFSTIKTSLLFPGSLIFYLIFINSTSYTNHLKNDFALYGSYLFICNILFLMLLKRINNYYKFAFFFIIIFCNLVWNTYLLNCFLCNSWIFT